jgi:hypothetical protein
MINAALASFTTANLSEEILQSNKYKEVRREWLQEEKLSDCSDYFHRLYAEGFLFWSLPPSKLVKFIHHDDNKYALNNAIKYQDCWGFRSYKVVDGKVSDELDTKVQIKIPKDAQDKDQKYLDQKWEREGGERKKAAKYKSSQGTTAPIFLMPIADRDHPLVVENKNAPKTLVDWNYIKDHPEIPIIIIEGGKKGAILAAYGYIVIVLPGVWQGLKKCEDYGKQIEETIALFASKKRQFYICFDNDPIEKKNTRESVGMALHQLARNLKFKTGVTPKVITWDYDSKGADDLIAEYGITPFHIAYSQAMTLGEWEALHFTRIYGKPDYEFEERYFPNDINTIPIDFNSVTKLLITAIQGAGKTIYIGMLINYFISKGYIIVALTSSDTLKNENAEIWGLNTIENLWNGSPKVGRYPLGVMGCGDSAKKIKAKVEELKSLHDKKVILIADECDQLFTHIETSTTEIEKDLATNRQIIKSMIEDCYLFIAADADMSGLTWDLINKIKGGKSYWINNKLLYRNRVLTLWDNPYKMTELGLLKVAKSDTSKGIVVTTQGGTPGSTYGTYTLENFLADKLDTDSETIDKEYITGLVNESNECQRIYDVLSCCGREIAILNRTTVSDPKHPCYGVTKDSTTLNKFLSDLSKRGGIAIISNLLPTGVSIKEGHNFGYEFSYGQGVNTPTGFIQHFNRVRGDDVERHIYVTEHATFRLQGNGSATYRGILWGEHIAEKRQRNALEKYYDIKIDSLEEDYLLDVYSAKIRARNNLGYLSYREWVIGLLKYKWQYQIRSSDNYIDLRTVTHKVSELELKQHSEIIYTDDDLNNYDPNNKKALSMSSSNAEKKAYIRIARAKPLNPDEYKKLKTKEKIGEYDQLTKEITKITPDESDRLLKTEFIEHTGGAIPCTGENIYKYHKEGYLSKLRLMYYCTLKQSAIGELDAIAIEFKVKNKKSISRKTFGGRIAAKYAFLKDMGCEPLLNALKDANLLVSNNTTFDPSVKKSHILLNMELFHPDFFTLEISKDIQIDPSKYERSIQNPINDGSGDVLAFRILKSESWLKIWNNFKKHSGECKALLGFTPSEKSFIPFVKGLLGCFAMGCISTGNGKKASYYLSGFDYRVDFWQFLDQRSSQILEDESINKLLLGKLESGDAVTTYIKNAVAGLPALGESITLSELAEWGSMQQPVIDALQTALDAGYEAYGVARGKLFENMGANQPNPILNRIISDAITDFEVQNKVKLAKLSPIFWSSKEALNNKDLWIREIENKNPAALLIDRIRRGVNATQAFITECRDTYQRYSQCFDSWIDQRLISPSEYQAVRGS